MATTFNDTYEIRSVIGKGGMSTVYLAEHKRLHTRWAVKEVRKEQGARFDFLAESNILKRLQHPMLPRIVDIFEDAQHIFIVEDYVEGETLETVLKRQGKVDEATGLQWFRDLCGVLDYLHNQKPNPIIYRDMKPSNVMLQPDGSLKLIDFGIAREYKQDSNADTTYIGTKGYAAPEQFGTAQTDARTDIYALGVTMYHLLTGKSPYEPPYQFVPARQLEPRLSHGVEYILDHCVQPEPADRYQSVRELLDDLEHIYKFDKAYQHYQAVKRTRVIILAVMFLASVGLMAGGRTEEAEAVLQNLVAQGADPIVTEYVQGEVYLAQEEYLKAESAFLSALDQAEGTAMRRRCYLSLGDLYRDCAALVRVSASPIQYPATKSAELLSRAVVEEGLRYDSALWETLALAYFEAYHTDRSVSPSYLQKSADCFQRVIELGVSKAYLYANLYTIYYEQKNYTAAEETLQAYEAAFPEDYMPHAFRGMMLITIENGKAQSKRDYRKALAEYETAGSMIRSSDETSYYQQLESLIQELRRNGWL